MANEVTPLFDDGDELPCVATAAVTGGRLVQVTATREGTLSGSGIDVGLDTTASGGRFKVGLPSASGALGAAKRVLGVACWDAGVGVEVTVFRGKIVPVTCAADVTAGTEVEVDTNGKVIPLASGIAVGLAMTSASNGGSPFILLYR